jgi:hypothetical protein
MGSWKSAVPTFELVIALIYLTSVYNSTLIATNLVVNLAIEEAYYMFAA